MLRAMADGERDDAVPDAGDDGPLARKLSVVMQGPGADAVHHRIGHDEVGDAL
jgi:hypothetical protein